MGLGSRVYSMCGREGWHVRRGGGGGDEREGRGLDTQMYAEDALYEMPM